ncbi:hypothetical protein PCE1_000170 [Barthelona sp. PCE]
MRAFFTYLIVLSSLYALASAVEDSTDDISVLWHHDVQSLTYTDPFIEKLRVGSELKTFVSVVTHHGGFKRLRGTTGHEYHALSFSAMKSIFSTPLDYDVDNDGKDEVMIMTSSGDLLFIEESGLSLPDLTIRVPPLGVKRNWYKILQDKDDDSPIYLDPKGIGHYFIDDSEDDKKHTDTKKHKTPESPSGPEEKTEFVPEALETFFELFSSHIKSDVESPPRFRSQFNESSFQHTNETVFIPPHVLTDVTRVSNWVIVPVSYYWEHDEAADGVEVDKYVAGAVVGINLNNMNKPIRWVQHMDLTTVEAEHTPFLLHSMSVLTVGRSERVYIGNDLGVLFCFHMRSGRECPHFPVEVGSGVSSKVEVLVSHDPHPLLIFTTSKPQIVAVTLEGEIKWTVNLTSVPLSAPLPIPGKEHVGQFAITLISGQVAIYDHNGVSVQNITVDQTLVSRKDVLLLDDKPYLVSSSSEGNLVMIGLDNDESRNLIGDFGDLSISKPIFDDIDEDGFLEAVITSNDGGVYAFETDFKESKRAFDMRIVHPEPHAFLAPTGLQEVHFFIHDDAMKAPYRATFAWNHAFMQIRPGVFEAFIREPGLYRILVPVPPSRNNHDCFRLDIRVVDSAGRIKESSLDSLCYTDDEGTRMYTVVIALMVILLCATFLIQPAKRFMPLPI